MALSGKQAIPFADFRKKRRQKLPIKRQKAVQLQPWQNTARGLIQSMKAFVHSSFAAFLFALLCPAPQAWAMDSAPIQQAVSDFLTTQAKGLPGQARFSIGTIRASGLPDGCLNFQVSMDAQARPWGKTHVAVRCTEGTAWLIYVPVEIHVQVNYLASARPLSAGQVIAEADITQHPGDLADLPQGVLTEPQQALGLSARVSLPAGRPLRADMLSQIQVIKQGQNVKVISGSADFQVSSDGRALNHAVAGQVVQVRLASGQVISGIAQRDGSVTIAY